VQPGDRIYNEVKYFEKYKDKCSIYVKSDGSHHPITICDIRGLAVHFRHVQLKDLFVELDCSETKYSDIISLPTHAHPTGAVHNGLVVSIKFADTFVIPARYAIDAVKYSPSSIRFVSTDPDSEEFNLDAINLALDADGRVIRNIKSPTNEMQCRAIRQNPLAIGHILDPTYEACTIAIKMQPSVLMFMPRKWYDKLALLAQK
jgi:hypothetical protein